MAHLVINTAAHARAMRDRILALPGRHAIAHHLGRPMSGWDAINLSSLANALQLAAHQTTWPCRIGGVTAGLQEIARSLLADFETRETAAAADGGTPIDEGVFYNARLDILAEDQLGPVKKTLEDVMDAARKAGTVISVDMPVEDEPEPQEPAA